MTNKVDRRDDEVFKFIAPSPKKARVLANRSNSRGRFDVGEVYNTKDFRRKYPDWYSLLSSQRAETVNG
jgi:hypothetical protein